MALSRGRGRERRGTPADLVVVGLGNPGPKYEHTRHNVGFDTVELLASRHGSKLKAIKGIAALSCEIRLGALRVVLVEPTTFMNESGMGVGPVLRRHSVDDPGRLVVVHDELDLPPGRLKVKVGGGLAGHNGLRSIKDHCHTTDFIRIRIGVGKPPDPERGADHVLRRVPAAERTVLDAIVGHAADAVECIATDGAEAAMERFNGIVVQ
jgi:peptidyl-tRNA hydrolase, PTH1 family